MRTLLLILGVLLLLGGGYVVFTGLSVTTDRTVAKVGPLEATVSEKRTVPTWVGGVAAAAGLLFIIVGAGGRGANRT